MNRRTRVHWASLYGTQHVDLDEDPVFVADRLSAGGSWPFFRLANGALVAINPALVRAVGSMPPPPDPEA